MSAITIHVDFDDDARVWVAQSDEISLVTEADTFEILYRKLPDLIQDVLAENRDVRAGQDVRFELVTHSHSSPRIRVAPHLTLSSQIDARMRCAPLPLWERVDRPKAEPGEGQCLIEAFYRSRFEKPRQGQKLTGGFQDQVAAHANGILKQAGLPKAF